MKQINSKNKKIVAGMMACSCVLSLQTLVQYGLLVGNGGIIAKHSYILKVFGESGEDVLKEETNEVENKLKDLKIEDVGMLDDNNIYDGCKYRLEGEEATLIYCNRGQNKVKIPKYVEKDGTMYSVTSIGVCAFCGCSSLTGINIPKGVTSIGNCAFCGCSSLTGINIPEGVASIGAHAFQACEKLTEIDISKGVTSIGNCAFCGCGSLTGINIPKGVTSIGERAFKNCINLIEITLPRSVTSIGKEALDGCCKLTTINIPEGVQYKKILERMGLGDKIVEVDNIVGENIYK